MTIRTKKQRVESDSEPCGFRIKPNGELEMISAAEVHALVVRAFREAMVNAGFRIKSRDRTLH
jgi:hypothetical protein